MSRSPYRNELTYVQALDLLGAKDSRALELAGRLTRVPAGAATAATLGIVDFVGVRDELVRWGQSLLKRFRSWVAGADRYSRGELLGAAHTVVVITAFYEGLETTASALSLDLGTSRLRRSFKMKGSVP